MRVGLDATPLLGARTGVGRYVEHLLKELTEPPALAGVELVATAFTLRGAGGLPRVATSSWSGRAATVTARSPWWQRAARSEEKRVSGAGPASGSARAAGRGLVGLAG